MSFLSSIVLLLSGLFSLAAFIGLFAPKLFTDKKTGNVPKRSQLFFSGIVMSVILLVVGLFMTPKDDAATTPAAETASTTANSEQMPSSPDYKPAMPFTFSEWRTRANDAISGTSSSNPIPENLQPTGNKKSINYTAAHTLRDGLELIAATRPDNSKVTSISLIAAPGGKEPATIISIIADAAAILAASDPGDDRKLPGRIFKMTTAAAQKFAKKPEKDAQDSFSHNGIKYSVMLSQYTGLMLFAEPLKSDTDTQQR